MRHLIITRLICRRRGRLPSRRWMEHRLGLFERFTLPSVCTQTTQRFRWVWLVDPGIPARFAAQIESLRKLALASGVSVLVAPRMPPVPDGWTLSTRLDSDDAIRSDFAERLHAVEFEPPAEAVLTFPYGWFRRKRCVHPAKYTANHFVTLCEHVQGEYRGVYQCDHHKICERYPVRVLGGERMWLSVLHNRNAAWTVTKIRLECDHFSRRHYPPERIEGFPR